MRLKSIIIALLILASSSFFLVNFIDVNDAIKPDDSINGEQYIEGTWSIINFPEEYDNETIYLTGNITSYNLLTLINSTIKMNSTGGRLLNINFYTTNSNLTLKENSVITANDTNFPYDMVLHTGSHAYIANSEISYAGYYGGVSEGLLIKSSSVLFDNALISNNYNGIICDSVSPQILNSRIENSVINDIVLNGNSHPIIVNTSLNKSKVEVHDTSSLVINWYMSLRITNQSTDEALSDVKVTIKNATNEIFKILYTDSNGNIATQTVPECVIYSDKTIEHSPFTIELEKENYKSKTVSNIVLTQSRALELNMTLKPQDGIIQGNVTDESNNPLQGVKITVLKEGDERAVQYTNSTGQYKIMGIPEDTGYTVTAVNLPEYDAGNVTDVTVIGNNVSTVNFKLSLRDLPISVLPVDGSKKVIFDTVIIVIFEEIMNMTSLDANFDLKSNSTGMGVEGNWSTSDNMTFIFTPKEDLSHGDLYSIRIVRYVKNQTGKMPLWKNFQSYFTTAFGPPKIDVMSPSGTDVQITKQIYIAFDQTMNKTSVENAITISPPVTGTIQYEWSSYGINPDASVSIIFQLSPGTVYNITISTSAKSAHDIPMAQTRSWEFKTQVSEGGITGKVIDEGFNPIEGAKIEFSGETYWTLSGSDGRFNLAGITPGYYTIIISKEGYEDKEISLEILAGQVYNAQEIELKKEEVIKEKEEKEDEISAELMAAYIIAIILFLIILIIIVFMSIGSKEEAARPREERVDYMDLGLMREGEEKGAEEEKAPPKPEFRGRCPVCKHIVYGDAGCFHCASSAGAGYYSYSEEGEA